MDFFERQETARRKTKWLVLYFLLAVALTIAAIYWGFALVWLWQADDARPATLWHPALFGWVSVFTLGIVLAGSSYKIAQLSKGGGAVARTLGGQLVNPQTTDPDERKLLNVIEEMAIASGTPVPEVYLMNGEQGINAFAAGYSPTDAAVGVTRGCIQLLNRDELQGVIAHEFSHILNGDMRINLRLLGMVHGILCLAIIGRILLYSGSRRHYYRLGARKKGGNPLPLIGIVLWIVGSIGVFFGRLIKSAISRQREYLADAAAVQFTRNPGGLAGALKKIGGVVHGSRIENPIAEEASHMFFGNALAQSMFSWMATHPPLDERIRLLDPHFDGKYPKVTPPSERERETPPPLPPRAAMPPALEGIAPAIHADTALSHIGAPTAMHLSYAGSLLAAIPGKLTQAAHEPFSACALVYALLLSPDPASRQAQLRQLEPHCFAPVFGEMSRLLPHVSAVKSAARLPLVELAIPSLKLLSASQYDEFVRNVNLISESDQQIDLFEFALQKMLLRHLEPQFKQVPRPATRFHALQPLAADSAVLLSALAHVGQDDPEAAAHAFQVGARQLNLPGGTLPFHVLAQCTLERIDTALNKLNQAAPPLKKRILNACARTVAADGVVQPAEGELLRAIADSLDCPLPPFIAAP